MTGIVRAGSRRDVLKITAAAGVGALFGGGPAAAAPKKHDDDAREFVHPAVRRLLQEQAGAGVREGDGHQDQLRIVSVGSLQTRVTTAAENGAGPDMT